MLDSFLIKSELSQLSVVQDWLKDALASEVDSSVMNNILLITQEMVTNSIQHGNNGDPNKEVTLNLHIDTEHVVIKIQDEGAGIKRLPNKDEAKELDYLAENGRGLKLAVLICHEIILNGNEVTLVFNKEATA